VIEYPYVPFEHLLARLQSKQGWLKGEHVGLVGPTGCGKTTVLSRILPIRRYVVVFVTKVHDDVISRQFPGFTRIVKWPPSVHEERVLLWPRAGKTIPDTKRIQREVFSEALNKIFQDRQWCVVFDEQHYMCQTLRLADENAMFLHQGRSSGLSIVNGTQRPAWVPVVTYSSITHAFLWRNKHKDDLRRLADLGGIDSRELQNNLLRLGKHEFVYVNTRTDEVVRSQVK
jgi:hypothetical protein